jgi:hypothetical protein
VLSLHADKPRSLRAYVVNRKPSLETLILNERPVARHSKIQSWTSTLGQERTVRWVRVMSDILLKADIRKSECLLSANCGLMHCNKGG